MSLRGVRCKGQRGHGALHSAEIDAVLFAWSDESSPTLAIDLYWPGGCSRAAETKVNYGRATAMERAAEAQRAYERATATAGRAPAETTTAEG